MKWEFTPDEFIYLWEQTGRDRYPFPLQLRSALAWQSEVDEFRRGFSARMPRENDADLSAVLRVAADPAVSLAMIGDRKQRIRAYGAVAGNVGVSMVQRPGPAEDFGGNIIIQVGSDALPAKVFAAVLGNVPAGRQRPLVASLNQIQLELESWTGSKETVTDRMRRLLHARRAGSGHIEVQGGLRDARTYPAEYVSWFDVVGDGRYLYRQQYNDFRIDPCPQQTIQHELTRLTEAANRTTQGDYVDAEY